MRDPRLEKLADVLVNYSVAARTDQLVRISGQPLAEPLILEIFRKLIAAGAHPFVRMSPEALQEILVKHGSDGQLKYVNPLSIVEYEKIDCSIGIWAEENTRAMTNADAKRIGINQAARQPLLDIFM